MPRYGDQLPVVPLCLDPCAVPTATVVQDKYESRLIAFAGALHDVKIIIHGEHFCRAGSVLFVDFDERIDSVLISRLGQVPVKVILPEDAWITFVREDERVG